MGWHRLAQTVGDRCSRSRHHSLWDLIWASTVSDDELRVRIGLPTVIWNIISCGCPISEMADSQWNADRYPRGEYICRCIISCRDVELLLAALPNLFPLLACRPGQVWRLAGASGARWASCWPGALQRLARLTRYQMAAEHQQAGRQAVEHTPTHTHTHPHTHTHENTCSHSRKQTPLSRTHLRCTRAPTQAHTLSCRAP